MKRSQTLMLTVVGGGMVCLLTGFAPRGSDVDNLCLPGIVETHEVALASTLGGRVARLLVSEGDRVECAQPLLELDAPQVSACRARLVARLEAAEMRLALVRSGPRKQVLAAARATVQAAAARLNRLRAGPRDQTVRQAQQDLLSAEATLQERKASLQRVERLYEEKVESKESLDRIHAQYQQAASDQRKAAAQLELLQAGTHPEEIAEAAAQLDVAQAKYDELLAGTRPEEIAIAEAGVQQLQAELQETEIQLAESVIHAPGPGTIEVLPVREGDVLRANQPAVQMLGEDDVWIKLFVPETVLGRLRIGQPVKVRVDCCQDQWFDGQIRSIASRAEFTPRNVQTLEGRRHQRFGVKVRVADPVGVLKSGMAAEVLLPTEGNRINPVAPPSHTECQS